MVDSDNLCWYLDRKMDVDLRWTFKYTHSVHLQKASPHNLQLHSTTYLRAPTSIISSVSGILTFRVEQPFFKCFWFNFTISVMNRFFKISLLNNKTLWPWETEVQQLPGAPLQSWNTAACPSHWDQRYPKYLGSLRRDDYWLPPDEFWHHTRYSSGQCNTWFWGKNQQTTSEKAADSSCDTLSNELPFLDRWERLSKCLRGCLATPLSPGFCHPSLMSHSSICLTQFSFLH